MIYHFPLPSCFVIMYPIANLRGGVLVTALEVSEKCSRKRWGTDMKGGRVAVRGEAEGKTPVAERLSSLLSTGYVPVWLLVIAVAANACEATILIRTSPDKLYND
mmetsp:Transcript_518/g.751  ORF Transcript_518/g.751 Transcript_518/m.751 type:complete len:105 (-) Transcript_518:586-900(-)